VNGSHNIVGNTIAYNESDRYGAGIRVSSGEHNIEGNVISNNRSHGGSAGIYIAKGNHTIINNTISENFSELSNGGGVFITGGTHIISGNTITNNTCTGDYEWLDEGNLLTKGGSGGGLFIADASCIIDGNSIIGNTAVNDVHSQAGGLYIWKGSAVVSNNTISENQAGRPLPSRRLHTPAFHNHRSVGVQHGTDFAGQHRRLSFHFRKVGLHIACIRQDSVKADLFQDLAGFVQHTGIPMPRVAVLTSDYGAAQRLPGFAEVKFAAVDLQLPQSIREGDN